MSDPNPTTSTPDDRVLARAVAERGDERAFRVLYRRHTPRLHRFALRLLASPADAEEVVQETWIRAARALGAFRWESTLSTWLLGIGRNLCRETLRRRGRLDALEGPENSAAPGAEPTAPTAPTGLRLDLERALRLLPNGCRAVVVLHDIEGFTHDEIASELGLAVGTSKSQLFEGRRRLRLLLHPIQDRPAKEKDHARHDATRHAAHG